MPICISLNLQFTYIRNAGGVMRDSQCVWVRSGAGSSHGYSGWMRNSAEPCHPMLCEQQLGAGSDCSLCRARCGVQDQRYFGYS